MIRRAATALALALLVLTGCGNSEAQDALNETAAELGGLRSGDLSLTVSVEPDTEDSAIGFRLDGPVALADRSGELPRAQLLYTQIAGPNRGDVTFISSGEAAWVEVEGQPYELPPEQLERLAAGGGEGGGPLAELDVASWTDDAELTDGPRAGGQPTEKVRGEVDVAAALDDIVAVLEEAGGSSAIEGLGPLEDDDAEALDEAVRSSSLALTTGRDDRLLRRLRIAVEFGVEPRELAGGLGRLSGARLTLDLRISEPNGPVEIEEPASALPYEQLPSG